MALNLRRGWVVATSMLALSFATPLLSQGPTFSNGTYVLEGGSYSITVERQGDTLVVVEPNKRSVYNRHSDGSYHFYNPNTDATYGLRVIDEQTIEAFKPFQGGNVPTRLTRLGGRPSAPAPAPAAPPTNASAAIAERYRQLSTSDPDNAQAWTACAAAALKSSLATEAEAMAYAAKMAGVLKLIVVDASRSPCEDAIPASVWDGVGATSVTIAVPTGELPPAEKERLRKLNEAADARVEAAKVEGRRLEEAQAAYRARVAEVKAAEEKFARDKAAHEAELAKAAAAQAEFERKLEEHRRLLATGKFSRAN